ncbi:hypothetical protein CSKR_110968 [Clonorchis sinensis]|uniref:Uncharacterized protein n=1 Tax=Clonorchis sinensis TaxID=79923 RepID=A0A419PY25_CLOSI|nr:hypothetical protein CSKR_110968 [Clonorchis sinensis]
MYIRDALLIRLPNIVATGTRGGLVQHIQLPENITNERFSWVPVSTNQNNRRGTVKELFKRECPQYKFIGIYTYIYIYIPYEEQDGSVPSCFLRVTWQLGTERVLQLNDYYYFIIQLMCQDDPNLTKEIRKHPHLFFDKLISWAATNALICKSIWFLRETQVNLSFILLFT